MYCIQGDFLEEIHGIIKVFSLPIYTVNKLLSTGVCTADIFPKGLWECNLYLKIIKHFSRTTIPESYHQFHIPDLPLYLVLLFLLLLL